MKRHLIAFVISLLFIGLLYLGTGFVAGTWNGMAWDYEVRHLFVVASLVAIGAAQFIAFGVTLESTD